MRHRAILVAVAALAVAALIDFAPFAETQTPL